MATQTDARANADGDADERRLGQTPDRLAAFEERSLALADADTERCDPIAAAAAAQLVQQRDDEAGAAHPERMADRDRAAVHVHLLLVEAEVADHRKRLRRERLVELDEIDLGERHTGPFEELAHRLDRP